MQKWSALVFAAVVAASVAALFLSRPKSIPGTGPAASASASAGPAASASAPAPLADAGAPGPSDAGPGGDEPALLLGPSDAGVTLPDGSPAPGLAGDAPKSVTFGVILVQYRGAQFAPGNARSKEAALELAKQLAADAKKDFKATVPKGDKGSQENAGKMQRGFLEPAPEYVLFSLPKDGVSDPVDTPRGYWIVRRID
jgi:hypothetical protein